MLSLHVNSSIVRLRHVPCLYVIGETVAFVFGFAIMHQWIDGMKRVHFDLEAVQID